VKVKITFGEKFKLFRDRLHINQDVIAQKVETPQPYLSKIELGKVTPRPILQKKLIEALGMSVEEFNSLQPGDNFDQPQPEDMVELPLYGSIPAGPPANVQNHIGETHRVLRHQAGPGRYVLRVIGDSMAPELRDRDLILIKYLDGADAQYANEKICVACLNGECTLKKIVVDDEGRIILKPENPNYEPIIVNPSDTLRIQGVMLRLIDRVYE
jgi:repressor LexA